MGPLLRNNQRFYDAPVVKLQEKLPIRALPAESFIPLVIDTVYEVFGASGALGINVTVVPLRVTVPTTEPAALLTVMVSALTVVVSSASLNVAVMTELMATPVALATGEVETTVGEVVSPDIPVVKLQVKVVASGVPEVLLAPLVIVAV